MTAEHHIEKLKYLRIAACFTMSCLGGPDTGESLVAAAEIEDMMESFFKEYGTLCSPGDQKKAKENPELFISIIDQVIHHFMKEVSGRMSA